MALVVGTYHMEFFAIPVTCVVPCSWWMLLFDLLFSRISIFFPTEELLSSLVYLLSGYSLTSFSVIFSDTPGTMCSIGPAFLQIPWTPMWWCSGAGVYCLTDADFSFLNSLGELCSFLLRLSTMRGVLVCVFGAFLVVVGW